MGARPNDFAISREPSDFRPYFVVVVSLSASPRPWGVSNPGQPDEKPTPCHIEIIEKQ